MKFDLSIKNNDLTIYCTKGLEKFSNEFITYYNEDIERVKNELLIDKNIKVTVVLTDNKKQAAFVYGKSDFSGFFNENGLVAYINLNGEKTKDYMFKGLMHELTHHLYKYYIYGADKERITWVDEGIAQFFSGEKNELQDMIKYRSFLDKNLKYIDNIDLNVLNHNDRSFGNSNGYNLSYIAIRYLYETNNTKEFIDIIKTQEILLELGNRIIRNIKEYYDINNKRL